MCLGICMSVCMHESIHICLRACVCFYCVCVCVCVFVCVCVCVCVCICISYLIINVCDDFRQFFKNNGAHEGRGSLIEAENHVNPETYQSLEPPSKKKLLTFKTCKECFFIVVRFLATLALVPLVYMQALDVNEWICISGETFCGTPEKRTNLTIFQTATTLTFVLCAFIISNINLERKEETLYTTFKRKHIMLENINYHLYI